MLRGFPCALALTLFLLTALAACRAGPDRAAQAELFAAAREAQPAGHALFLQHCAGCHGVEAGGGIGPRLIANPRVEDASYVSSAVAAGRRSMPGFASVLSEEDLLATTDFVTMLAGPGRPE